MFTPKKKRILFVSEMKDMKNDASSTQIMTYNLLYGMYALGYSVTFIAIIDRLEIENSVKESFGRFAKVYTVPSALKLISKNRTPIGNLLVTLSYRYRFAWYKKNIEKLSLTFDFDEIVTHLPAIEGAFYAEVAKKLCSGATYIQYWSDPYARSGLDMKDTLSAKRYPLKCLERSILKEADQIVYGTDPLYESQRMEFPTLSNRMRSCDVSYSVYQESKQCDMPILNNKNYLVGYVGGYNSLYRDIKPLYNAFKTDPSLGTLVVCGDGDILLKSCENIVVLNRCEPAKATFIERQLDLNVCLLNSSTSQIPGKIFYNVDSQKPILVILDGKSINEIKKYLQKFNRYEFCENDPQQITKAIERIKNGGLNASCTTPDLLTPERFAYIVCAAKNDVC